MGSARVKFDVWACRQSRPKYKSTVPELIHTSNLTCTEPNNQSSTFEPGLSRVASHAGVSRGSSYFVPPHRDKIRALYSTASDPQQQMIPRPQMIPKMDRKWSSTASDPKVDHKWFREKLREWIGSYGTDYKKGLIIKRNLFLLPSTEKDKEDARSQVNLYKAKKKMEEIWKWYDFKNVSLTDYEKVLIHLEVNYSTFKSTVLSLILK